MDQDTLLAVWDAQLELLSRIAAKSRKIPSDFLVAPLVADETPLPPSCQISAFR